MGILAKWWIPDWPETANFLTEDERAMLVGRLALDAGDANMDYLNKKAARRIMKDIKIYLGTFAYMGAATTGYASSVSSYSRPRRIPPNASTSRY